MLPVPSWSDRKNSRPAISIGLASCPPRSARTLVNRGSSPVATHSLPARPPRYRFQNAGSPATLPVSSAVPESSMARSLTSPYGSSRGGGPPPARAPQALRHFVACPPPAGAAGAPPPPPPPPPPRRRFPPTEHRRAPP